MRFLFSILDAKTHKFTHVKFEKKTDVKFRNGTTCIKQVITKPSNAIVLCYLALYAFHDGVFLVK